MNMASVAVSITDWREAAICRVEHLDPQLFFPDSPDEITPEAVSACGRCPVRHECEYALHHEQAGTWGGQHETAINQIRRALRIRVQPNHEATAEQVAELWAKGFTAHQIAGQYAITERSVYRHLEAAGVAVTDVDDWRRNPNNHIRRGEDEEKATWP